MAADAAIYDCIVVGGGVMGSATAWATDPRPFR